MRLIEDCRNKILRVLNDLPLKKLATLPDRFSDVECCITEEYCCGYMADCLDHFKYCPYTGRKVDKKIVRMVYSRLLTITVNEVLEHEEVDSDE